MAKSQVDSRTGSPLGNWVRATRMEQGLSQRELATRAALSRSYVCDIERGRGAHPSVETLDKLAAALGAARVDLMKAAGLIDPVEGGRESPDERRLLAVFRDLSDVGQQAILHFARFVHTDEHQWVQASMLETLVAPDAATPMPPGRSLFDLDDIASG
jgi:transcriptional regulator with XRE-family HTH domain